MSLPDAASLDALAALIAEKVRGPDQFQATRCARPLDLLEDYLREKARQGREGRYLTTLRQQVGAFLRRVKSIEDLTAATIPEVLGQAIDDAEAANRARYGKDDRRGLRPGPRTTNGYLKSLRSFFGWLVKTERWPTNPAMRVELVDTAGRGRGRWALTEEHLTALVDSTPLWRSVVYLFAGNTGLRRNELRQLREVDVDLDRATVRVRARVSKNRREALLPLSPWVVELVRTYLAAVPPDFVPHQNGKLTARGERLFVNVPAVETVRRDLERVGINVADADGDLFDFHSLRVSFATILARRGVALQVVSRLMRHSDVRLTMAIYTRLSLADGHEAVAGLGPQGRLEHEEDEPLVSDVRARVSLADREGA